MPPSIKGPICDATHPLQFSAKHWWIVLKATFGEIKEDNVTIISAGVAFFTMLSIFPLITACISVYGFFADPQHLQTQLNTISPLIPPEAWRILDTQIQSVINAPQERLGLRIIMCLLFALWSAGAGIRAIMRAMNVAYGEKEKRHFVKFYALAIFLTLSVTLFLWISLAVIVGVPAVLIFIQLDGLALLVTRYIPWVILICLFAIAMMILYRVGPSRRQAKLRWVYPGAIFATLLWLTISAAFSHFVSEFQTYNVTYGGLSAVIILLIWFWLTAYVIILGAELNAELERYTSVDTTCGEDRPIGERGAAMADFIELD